MGQTRSALQVTKLKSTINIYLVILLRKKRLLVKKKCLRNRGIRLMRNVYAAQNSAFGQGVTPLWSLVEE